MAKLKDIDQKAEEKGSLLVTAWQFAKFIVVSLLAMIVQFTTLNILYLIPAVKALETQEFRWFVFNYDVAAGGLKAFLAINIANVLAQVVAFFVNRKKTFGGTNSVPITLTVYLAFTAALVCFSAWLAPTLTEFMMSRGTGAQGAGNIAAMACSVIQFIAYFPFNKLIMRDTAKKSIQGK
ncbi:MAG: hypothetical protein FWH26_01635 [Oscillospiraceae bacterium]|nr:hypothetical protein [Oscillospiraceae bacterium]